MSARGAGRSVIAYRRRATPAARRRGRPSRPPTARSLATAALIVEHPLLLGALLSRVLGAAARARARRRALRAGRRAIAADAAPDGARQRPRQPRGADRVRPARRLGRPRPGQPDASRPSSTGSSSACDCWSSALACLLVVCTANPDELLHALRRISPRSALTASLTTRLIPVLGEDARRLAEAQRCRPDGGARGARGRLAILRATVSGALERSLDVAAVLEMRGYGAARRHRRARGARARATTSPSRCSATRPPGTVDPGARSVQRGSLHRLSAAQHGADARHDRPGARSSSPSRWLPFARPPRDRAVSVLRFEHVTYRYPGARWRMPSAT